VVAGDSTGADVVSGTAGVGWQETSIGRKKSITMSNAVTRALFVFIMFSSSFSGIAGLFLTGQLNIRREKDRFPMLPPSSC
jgi:hypothetical protein